MLQELTKPNKPNLERPTLYQSPTISIWQQKTAQSFVNSTLPTLKLKMKRLRKVLETSNWSFLDFSESSVSWHFSRLCVLLFFRFEMRPVILKNVSDWLQLQLQLDVWRFKKLLAVFKCYFAIKGFLDFLKIPYHKASTFYVKVKNVRRDDTAAAKVEQIDPS